VPAAALLAVPVENSCNKPRCALTGLHVAVAVGEREGTPSNAGRRHLSTAGLNHLADAQVILRRAYRRSSLQSGCEHRCFLGFPMSFYRLRYGIEHALLNRHECSEIPQIPCHKDTL